MEPNSGEIKDYTNDKLTQQIDNNFKYHAPDNESVHRYNTIRDYGKILANVINANVPDSREKSLALTKLEEVVMWANAGVARNS